jgi:hypothetical protein
MKKVKAQKPQMEDKKKFKKTKTEKEVSDKNSTDKDTIDKKSVHHGSKIKGALKKPKEDKISKGYENGKVSGAKPVKNVKQKELDRDSLRELKGKYRA